ncbi:MAG: aspartyl-tRNA(Asn)/glutamyl-tRNA(Gln) amidotransferase subunit [Thermoleophilaceae bacterium]|nr:aspartyl-tRNA(Asn)/glutamyl-tRNA(Gln) amidotransferase subunit [Thermoleophilaceae bacterium]
MSSLGRSASDLARAIRDGELSAREVVEAHAWRLHRAQPRTNALAKDRFAEALREADAADARVAAGADDLPPFLGVPCTVKESIALRGMPNSAGLVTRRDLLSDETAPAAQRMLDAGFIPLGVTNTSEMTMWIESDNRVYGRTRNAYDPHRIAGGSSGGEGAAVGSGGAPVGLGSDIGGSIRLPAFFNGVFGHKPSPGLVPNTGQFPSTEGEAARMLTMGPLTRRAEDLMPVVRLISGPDGRDARCEEIELGEPAKVELRGRRVLVADDASIVPPRRELRDARDRAADALAAGGARVENVSLKQLRRTLELYLAVLGDGAGVALSELVGDTGARPGSRGFADALRGRGPHTSALLITMAAERLNKYMPQGRTRKAIAAARSLQDEVTAMLGDGLLLHHPFARVAPRHHATVGRPWVVTPAAAFNLLGLPVTQVPLGLNGRGLPLGVQVAAAPGNDHLTIAAALELERACGGWVDPQAVSAAYA